MISYNSTEKTIARLLYITDLKSSTTSTITTITTSNISFRMERA
jgi:hypothetical protein